MNSAGKGDRPRSCFSDNYRKNYDEIFRKQKPLSHQIQEVIDDASKYEEKPYFTDAMFRKLSPWSALIK